MNCFLLKLEKLRTISYFDKGDYTNALKNFNIAYELDKDTYLLTDQIKKATERLEL